MPTARLRTVGRHSGLGSDRTRPRKNGAKRPSRSFGTTPAPSNTKSVRSTTVAKIETIFSVVLWGAMNALLLAVAFDSAGELDSAVTPSAMHAAAHSLTA